MFWLIFNHADAWGMTFIITSVSLALRGALTADTLPIPFALALGAWFAFALNDRFDAPYDAHEPDKARRNVFTRGANRQLDLILLISAAVLAGIYLSFGLRGMALGLAGLAAAWAYSGRPLRLKTRPGRSVHAAECGETFPI